MLKRLLAAAEAFPRVKGPALLLGFLEPERIGLVRRAGRLLLDPLLGVPTVERYELPVEAGSREVFRVLTSYAGLAGQGAGGGAVTKKYGPYSFELPAGGRVEAGQLLRVEILGVGIAFRVEEVSPPRRVVYRYEEGPVEGRLIFETAKRGKDGEKSTVALEIEALYPSPAFRLAWVLFFCHLHRFTCRTMLTQVKHLAEASQLRG